MKTSPIAFQVEGIRFLLRHHGRAILGDDMGLGKTYQIIAWLALQPELRPVVISCPATVKYVWQSQLWEHARIKSVVINGRTRSRVGGNIWIINDDILPYWVKTLLRWKPLVAIVDEAHRTQSRTSQRTKACKRLARKCPHLICATGTPIKGRPLHFWPMLNMVRPDLFRSFWKYAHRYCDPKKAYRGWDFRGASNLSELHLRVSELMLRRTKEEVMPELPRKMYTGIPVDLSNAVEYAEARDNFIQWWQKKRGAGATQRALKAVAFVRMGALMRIAGEGKVQALTDWIENWLTSTDRKLVVFTRHRIVLSLLRATFPGSAVIEGKTTEGQRAKEIKRFQTDKNCRLFFGNMRAAGEGTTLTASSAVLFAELGWTPAEHEQAEDRVLRIGQKAQNIDVYYMVGRGTIEEDILRLLDEKRTVVGQVVDGWAEDDIRAIVLRQLVQERI